MTGRSVVIDWDNQPDALEFAKQSWREGRSAAWIAAQLRLDHPKITTNAVIGKMHRLGIKSGKECPQRAPVSKMRRPAPQLPRSSFARLKSPAASSEALVKPQDIGRKPVLESPLPVSGGGVDRAHIAELRKKYWDMGMGCRRA